MKQQLLIETDILADHLTNKGASPSTLEMAMRKYVCFTTVLNSAELMYASETEEEMKTVGMLLSSLKILGLNSRYSLSVNDFSGKVKNSRYSIFCVVASVNKLAILTGYPENYKNTGLDIKTPQQLRGIN